MGFNRVLDRPDALLPLIAAPLAGGEALPETLNGGIQFALGLLEIILEGELVLFLQVSGICRFRGVCGLSGRGGGGGG